VRSVVSEYERGRRAGAGVSNHAPGALGVWRRDLFSSNSREGLKPFQPVPSFDSSSVEGGSGSAGSSFGGEGDANSSVRDEDDALGGLSMIVGSSNRLGPA
jgi:hypothetical protein